MNITLAPMLDPPPGERTAEVVERKGLGHPDTICDALAEEVSRALCRYYLDRFGRILHHNVDKALLCGGASSPRYGGGEVIEPIEIHLAGRVTRSVGGVDVPVETLAIEACRGWLGSHFHALDPARHVRLHCRFRPGSADLVDLFGRAPEGRVPLANDTSIGVGFAPLSGLEETVLDLEGWLNDAKTKRERPETGEDVKVMGCRTGDTVRLTVACAFVSRFVADAGDYLAKKASLAAALRERAAARFRGAVEVALNAADDHARGNFYLTVTGTSAEAGDDGQVGRGNRVTGLITPGRAMTLEAAAGKNPVTHVGKLYNLAATLIASDLVAALPGVAAAECALVSQIGTPIDRPLVVDVRLRTRDAGDVAAHSGAVGEIVRHGLGRFEAIAADLVAGRLRLY